MGVLGVSACLCGLFAGSASAATITNGVANIGGSVTVSATSIDFSTAFVALGSQTGSFSGLTGGTFNDNLTGGPTTGAVDIVDFVTFTSGLVTPIDFDLTYIDPGVGSAAACATNTVGNVCTPTGSPFTLTQNSGSVTVGLDFNGIAYTGVSGTGSTPTSAGFSTQIVIDGGTLSGLLTSLGGGGSATGVSYSATFTAVAPEPGTTLLFGAGLIGLCLMGHRHLRRS
jgi:hypothetical protein